MTLFSRTYYLDALTVLILGSMVGSLVAIDDLHKAVFIFIVLVSGITIAVFRPIWPSYLFVGVIFIIEEYPAVITENTRWIRTWFYADSIGIPGLYAYDIFFFIALLLLSFYMAGNRIRFKWLHFFLTPVLFLMSVIFLSVAISAFEQISSPPVVNYDVSMLGFDFGGSAVYLIGAAQLKTFLYIFLVLFVISAICRDRARLYSMVSVILVSILITICWGMYRLLQHTALHIKNGVPLFYDTASSMAFLLFIIAVASIYITRTRLSFIWLVIITILALVSVGLIALSFRRTVWLSAFLVGSWMFFRYSSKETIFKRIVGVTATGTLILFVLQLSGKNILPDAVTQRIVSTTLNESSTLYRLLIYTNAITIIKDAPIIGCGIMPMWNYHLRWGQFLQTYENVHSLYLWLLFRWGMTGLLGFIWLLWRFYRHGMLLLKNAGLSATDRAILLTTIYGMSGFLITAMFFPVYGMVRFMVMMGALLSIMESMAYIKAKEGYVVNRI